MQEQCECELIGILEDVEEGLVGELSNSIEYVYPELENLKVTPTTGEQRFKSDKYGYNEVLVHAVPSEELNITPGTEDQVYEGMYRKITVPGDADLIAENIKEGAEIFGVAGLGKMLNIKITNGDYLFYNGARFNYINEFLSLCGEITSAEKMFYQITQYGLELDLSELNTSKCTNMSNMFYACMNLEKLNVSKFDTSKVTKMDMMFSSCKTLTELDVSGFDTSNVTNMRYMFNYCEKVQQLDVSNFNTSNVTSIDYMFSDCEALTELDVNNFNVSKVTNLSNMFRNCRSLTKLDISNWNTINVTNIDSMFRGCIELEELNLGNLDFSNVSYVANYVFYNNYDLTILKSFKNLGKGYYQKGNNAYNHTLKLDHSTKLTYESLIDLLTNGLYDLNLTYDVANGGVLYTQSCVIGPENIAKLEATEEGQAVLAEVALKGWTIS